MEILHIAQAAGNSIVSCSGADCGVCSILEAASNIYNVILGISCAVAVLLLALSGLVYIFGTGRRVHFQRAKVFARNSILGFIFVLVGWLAIHAVLFSTGFKNAGNWWQFQCETGNYLTQKLSSYTIYPNLAGFMASGAKTGLIKGPAELASVTDQLQNLNNGEEITLYLPARNNKNQEEVQVPFLAGFKSSVDPSTLDLLTSVINGISNGDISLLDGNGSPLTSLQSNNLERAIMINLLQYYAGNDPNLTSLIDQLNSPSASLDDLIAADRQALGNMQQQNAGGTGAMAQLINDETNTALKNADVVTGVSSGSSGSSSLAVNDTSSSSSTSSGDRSASWTPGSPAGSTNPTSSTGQNSTSSYANQWTDQQWKDTQALNNNYKQNSGYKNLPSSKGENPIDPNGNIKDPSKDDKNMCNYDAANQGPTKPAEEALIRIECKDTLRYNMIHRFVRVIQNTTFQGGFTEGCGKINVNFNMPREMLDQIIVHEATHAGQFCLGLIDMGNIAKVEREAVGNQIGSLCKEKHDENEGKGTDDFLMQEITCSGAKDSPLCRQIHRVTYQTNTAGTGGEEVRGYISRWMTMVTPSGDLTCDAYDWPIKYAMSYGDTTMGPYHYGAHICGDNRVLGLKKEENEDIKTIVKSKETCRATSLSNLPDAKECKDSGAPPIQIDPTPAPPPG